MDHITLGGNGIFNSELLRPVATSAGAYDPDLATDHYLNLAAGVTVDVNAAFVVAGYGSINHIGNPGDPGKFVLDQAGFVGFEFQNVAGGDIHYGWLRFIPGNGGFGTIVDWAYNDTAGEGIQVGAIPEPSSSLVLLGSLAVLTFRRRALGR